MRAMLKKTFSRLFTPKRPFKLTKAGWVFILYTIGVGAGAINTGNNLLYLVFGIFLGLILASGLLSDLSLWKLEVEWDLPESFSAGELAVIPIRIMNRKKRFPSFSVHVEITGSVRGESIVLKTHAAFVAAGNSIPVYAMFCPQRRGLFQIQSVRLTTRYPFGLLQKRWSASLSSVSIKSCYVYPKITPLETSDIFQLMTGPEHPALVSERGEGVHLHSLREYKPSDNPRRIHWKTSAKNTGFQDDPLLMVREMEKDQELNFPFRLPSPEQVRELNGAEVELLVQYVASVLEAVLQMGRRARFILPVDEASGNAFEVKRDNSAQSGLDAEMRFLSLWDPVSPLSASELAFLSPVPEHEKDWHQDDAGILKGFQRWKSQRKEI